MKADREIKVRCSACGHLTRIATVTNADRIRAMTDEELAENVIVLANDDYCGGPDRCKGRSCYKCRLEWLKKEVNR